MLRIKTAAVLIGLSLIAAVEWRFSVGIILIFAILDFLLEKEDEENLEEVRAYVAAIQEKECQKQKDLKFKRIMEENQ